MSTGKKIYVSPENGAVCVGQTDLLTSNQFTDSIFEFYHIDRCTWVVKKMKLVPEDTAVQGPSFYERLSTNPPTKPN